MSHRQLTLSCIILSVLAGQALVAQDKPDPRKWSIDPRSTAIQASGVPPTPSIQRDVPRMTGPRVITTPAGILSVSPNMRVHPSTTTAQSEVPITRHPTNGNILYASSNAVHFSPSLFISEGMYLSTNGGATWFGSDTTAAAPLIDHSGDPAPAIGPDGRLYMSEIISDGMGVEYSTNMGQTWSNIITLVTGSQDKNHGFVNDVPSSPYYGYSYVTWSLFTESYPPAVVSYSSNGGVTWTAPITVLPAATGHYSQGVNGTVGANGDAYICWQNPIAGSPYTGDFIGFAKSTNGGAAWSGLANAYDCNGIRGTLSQKAGIRVNDFPSMAVDRSGGSRNGWVYIVTAEQNLSPAGSDPDIVFHRSTNGGATWSAGIRVNQDPVNNGKIQYMPWMCVDGTGGVNVVYYDDRTTTSDSASVFVSRSLDGGNTWTDMEVADHHFKPGPISGLAGGYQGDYIGITSGNGRVYPYWCDNSTGIYQAWVASVTTTENFGWVKGTVTNVSGGAALSGVGIDFTDPIPQVSGTSDGTGFYKAGAKVDTPATNRAVTLRARKFGFRDTLISVTVTRNDTVTRNFAMTTVPNGTLVIRTVRRDSTNIRTAVTVLFNGTAVGSGYTDSLTGIYSAILPLGSYDVLIDPPSPYGNRRFNSVVVGSGSNPLYVVVRAVVENSPSAMKDTLAVGQMHAKTLVLTNTTTADTIPYRLSDDNALARMSRPAVQSPAVRVPAVVRPKGAPDVDFGTSPTRSGGPDGFGYKWVDSDSIGGGVAFSWVEISGVGTPVAGWTGSTDDGYFATALPWSFPFYGNGFTGVNITTNGWLGFVTPSSPVAYSNTTLPGSADPNNAVYPWWDDLDAVGTSGDRTVYYYNDVANSRYIIEWNNVRHLSATTDTLKFQAILKPSGEILLQYLRMVSSSNLTTATIGMENADGSTGLQVVYNASYIHNNLAIRFYLPDAPWLSESPSFGRINPGATQNITVTFNAGSLLPGTTYNGKITLDLTHPDVVGSILIPASLKVQAATAPVIILSRTSIAFPPTEIGTSKRDSLTLRNGGSLPLLVSSITSSSPVFVPAATTGSIAPGDSIRIRVTYTAAAPAHSDTGRVMILSNDPLVPRTDVMLTGSSFGVAHVTVRPDTFYFSRGATTDTTFSTFKVLSTGTDTLRYTLNESSTSPLLMARAIKRSRMQQRSYVLAKGAADPNPGERDSSGGPDAFGYRWIDSDTPGGPSFNWVDISTVGTQITSWTGTSDDGYATVPFPLTFRLYGTPFTGSINVCTNGFVSFTSTLTSYTNLAIPGTSAPFNGIFPFWDDLNLSSGGSVYYYYDVTNSRFVVEYLNIPHFSSGGPYTFEVILKSDGGILYQYQNMDLTLINSSTIGIQDAAGSVALQVAYNAGYVHNNMALLITSDILPWMSTNPTQGTIAPGDSQSVALRIHPVGLTPGLYTGFQRIRGNTPDTSANVRVHLNVVTGGSSLTLTSPHGGETWNTGSAYPIAWTKTGSVDSVRLDYSTSGGGGPWIQISPAVPARVGLDVRRKDGSRQAGPDDLNGSYSWTIPAGIASANCYVRVAWKSNPSVFDLNDSPLTIHASGPGDTTVLVSHDPGWNMVSNPVGRTSGTDSVWQIFPTAISGYVFGFYSGYVREYVIPHGHGYWAKFPSAGTDSITGALIIRDSITITAGWNIVGSISRVVDTAGIVTVPPGLIASSWFGFSESGYTIVNQLIPGKGHFVKFSGSGKVVLANPLSGACAKEGASGTGLGTLSTLTIRDSRGMSQTLYFGPDENKDLPLELFAMPPAPPDGAFDVRFQESSGGSMVQTHAGKVTSSIKFPVTIQSDAYPLTVTWMVKAGGPCYELTDGLGGELLRPKRMFGDGTVTIAHDNVNRLVLQVLADAQLPVEFALLQNYPNPFNPATTIRYDLPLAAHVTLKVFNVLGQEVATLMNDVAEAGYKSVQFDASRLASGTYFYRLQAGGFTSVKKLLILK